MAGCGPLLAGCGGGGGDDGGNAPVAESPAPDRGSDGSGQRPESDAAPETEAEDGSGGTESEPPRTQAEFSPPPCPPDLSNCESASGRVIYVERVDPDGDGDAHFVTLSKESITGAGLTIFDVREDLRPDPLPGVGDIVGGAGPVYSGSRGQKQIEVVAFEVAE